MSGGSDKRVRIIEDLDAGVLFEDIPEEKKKEFLEKLKQKEQQDEDSKQSTGD